MKLPRFYSREPADEFVKISDLGPEHKGRVFEARDQKTGAGILGYLFDANHYLLDGVVAIRFAGQDRGIFDRADAMILMKAEGFTHPDLGDPPVRPGDPSVSGVSPVTPPE